jgi:hypothetical protein
VSLGLRLLAKLPASALDTEQLMNRIENWVRQKYSGTLTRTRQGIVESSPAVFCLLHPAAEEVELTLINPEHLVVSANTSTVGPGYHVFLTSMLHDWARDFHAHWEQPDESSEDYGDEADYFFTGDEEQLCDNMACWLQAVANSFFEPPIGPNDRGIALCMPMSPHFEADQIAITPLGPRGRDWLYETAQEGTRGKDFFAWWTPGFNAEYYLGRALTQMWSNVRWRLPVNDEERSVLKDVADSLRDAFQLNPTLPYPWAEWLEVLELLGGDVPEKELVRGRAKIKPTIGYRRRNVTVELPGGWAMQIPGSFSDFESDEDNNQFALDPPREIWFTSYRFTSSSSRETFESMRREMKQKSPEYLLERDDYIARATISKKRRDTGEEYFLFSSSNACPYQRAVCTILFSEAEQKDWALELWQSIKPPTMSKS